MPMPLRRPLHRSCARLPGLALTWLSLAGPVGAEPSLTVFGRADGTDIVTVRPRDTTATRQGLRQFVGISGANSGARGLSMNRVVIPPGGRAEPHRHVGSESAIYLLQGTVETRYGERLEKRVINRAGDFLFIPAGLPHQPVNLSRSEPAIALVARNDPAEQEHVEVLTGGGSPRP
ncbi:MAG: hypothetical protein RLZZ124_1781 [Cyanobacteriota bacterium]